MIFNTTSAQIKEENMRTLNPSGDVPFSAEFCASGISWAAVIGGAFVAAALWLTLTILGVGFGLSSISSWSGAGASSKAFGTVTIIWLIVTQIIASGLSGYLTGRLRTRWVTVPSDEVYFRDTAHGLLTWAVGVVIAAAFLGSACSMIVGSGISLSPTAAATGAFPGMPGSAYQVAPGGTFQRTPGSTATAPGGGETTPGGNIAPMPGGGETTPGAPGSPGMQVTPTPAPQVTLTKEDIEKARKAAAKASIWIFVALLVGAFCASIAALIGGRQRDSVVYYDVKTRERST
jgi:hypothetical protein